MTNNQRNKIIEIIVSGKGVIPYEKIETIDSLSIRPEDGFFFQKMNFLVHQKVKMLIMTANVCKTIVYIAKNERSF